jgi:hypothetical protein
MTHNPLVVKNKALLNVVCQACVMSFWFGQTFENVNKRGVVHEMSRGKVGSMTDRRRPALVLSRRSSEVTRTSAFAHAERATAGQTSHTVRERVSGLPRRSSGLTDLVWTESEVWLAQTKLWIDGPGLDRERSLACPDEALDWRTWFGQRAKSGLPRRSSGLTDLVWTESEVWLAQTKLGSDGDVRLRARSALRRDRLRLDRERSLEAAGVEPASEGTSPKESTCVSVSLISRPA